MSAWIDGNAVRTRLVEPLQIRDRLRNSAGVDVMRRRYVGEELPSFVRSALGVERAQLRRVSLCACIATNAARTTLTGVVESHMRARSCATFVLTDRWAHGDEASRLPARPRHMPTYPCPENSTPYTYAAHWVCSQEEVEGRTNDQRHDNAVVTNSYW